MHISLATQPGSHTATNEDFVVAAPDFVVVLDGLSAPQGLATGCIHGTTWFVHRLGGQLAQLLTHPPTSSLTDLLAQAISDVAASHIATCDLAHTGTPSATVAVVRERPTGVDYLVLSDSVIVLDGPQGTQVAVDASVEHVAAEELAAAEQHPAGSTSSTHANRVQELVAEQRRHRNQAGGYWVASTQPDAAHHAVTGTLPRQHVRRIAVMSDGAARLVSPFRLIDWPTLLDILDHQGPEALIRQVRQAELSDPHAQRWPRIKCHDDATAVLCKLTPA